MVVSLPKSDADEIHGLRKCTEPHLIQPQLLHSRPMNGPPLAMAPFHVPPFLTSLSPLLLYSEEIGLLPACKTTPSPPFPSSASLVPPFPCLLSRTDMAFGGPARMRTEFKSLAKEVQVL